MLIRIRLVALVVHECLHVYYTVCGVVRVRCLLVYCDCLLLVVVLRLGQLSVILIGLSDNRISNSFLHQINLRLPDKLHMCIRYRDHSHHFPPAFLGLLLHGRVDEEGVTLGREIEMLAVGGQTQKLRITLQLEQVILRLPNEGDLLELAKALPALRLRTILAC